MASEHESKLLEDSLALSGFPLFTSCKFDSSEDDEFMNSVDLTTTQTLTKSAFTPHPHYTDSNLARAQAGNIKQEARRNGWLHKLNRNEPVMLFTKSLVPDKLAAAGIIPSVDSRSGRARFEGRIGRGGEIVFDRWNPLKQTHVNCGNTLYVAP